MSPTLREVEEFITQETDVNPNELRCRVEDMTTSCRSTMGNISDALTTIIFDDLSRLLRTGMVYSKMAARMDELAEMDIAIEGQLSKANEYQRRLERVRSARIQLEHAFNELVEGDQHTDPQISVSAVEIASSENPQNDTSADLISNYADADSLLPLTPATSLK